MPLSHALEFAQRSRPRFFLELKDFIAIPSISTLPERKGDIQRAAEWLAHELTAIGLHAEIVATNGHPIVYGEWLGAPKKSTVLIYGHYDVQPVDPLDEWISPPFQATIRGDDMYGRGASDMKGNAHAVLKALEAWTNSGDLPVNIKVLFEGEEEIGSPNLPALIERYRDRLECNLVLNTDSGIRGPLLPSLTYGLRGLDYFEISVSGPKTDLHSGYFGGTVHNPAQVMCELLAGMHDEYGHVTLPGFYDNVRALSEDERSEFARLPNSDDRWREITGVPQLWGERGFSTLERVGARPTLEINGLISGFTGKGVKTIIPAKATAKVSFRTIPDQNDETIGFQLQQYLRDNAPPTVTWEIKKLESEPSAILDRDTPAMRAAYQALETTFGVKPVFELNGASVLAVSMIRGRLDVDTVLMGFGLPDDNAHAPNEKLHLPTYYRGIDSYIRFFDLLTGLTEKERN